MKKILISAAALLVAVAAQAQIVSSSSRSTISTPVERNGFSYIKGGLSLNNITGDDADGWDSKAGFDVVIGTVMPMTAVDGLYVGYEVGVGTRGAKNEVEGIKEELSHTNIKLVPQAGFLMELSDGLAIDVHLGLGLTYDFMGKAKISGSYSGVSLNETIKMKDYEEKLDWNAKRFDVGIHPGVTLWYNNFGIDFTYQRGFLNIIEEDGDDYDVFTSNIQLRLAYRF